MMVLARSFGLMEPTFVAISRRAARRKVNLNGRTKPATKETSNSTNLKEKENLLGKITVATKVSGKIT